MLYTNYYSSFAEYARFEAKIHELREQMISSNSQEGTLQTAAKKSFYVRSAINYASLLSNSMFFEFLQQI